jgi:hypothetical protein
MPHHLARTTRCLRPSRGKGTRMPHGRTCTRAPLAAALGLLFLLGTGLAGAAFAETPAAAVLSGTVTDADSGAPVDDVRVTLSGLLDSGESLLRTARTGPDGRYRLEDLPPGRFMLTFSLRGTDPVELVVELAADRTTEQDATLQQTAAVLEELVVTGTALDSEARLQTGFVTLDAASLARSRASSRPTRCARCGRCRAWRRPRTSPAASTSAAAAPTRRWC